MHEHRRQQTPGRLLRQAAMSAATERGVIPEELHGRFDRGVVAGPHRSRNIFIANANAHRTDADLGGENDRA